MVVAVGLTFVEPLADAEVNVPGVMAMPVAPDDAQLSVLLVPELMLIGSTLNEEIVGAASVPGGEPDEVVEPHPANIAQVIRRMRKGTGRRRYRPNKFGPRKPR